MAKKRANSEGNIRKRWPVGRALHRWARSGDRKGDLQERPRPDPGRDNGQAKSGHRGNQELGRHQSREIHSGCLDGRVVRELRKDQSETILSPDLPGGTSITTSSRISAKFRWKSSLLWSYRSSTRSYWLAGGLIELRVNASPRA